jgi:hypothetical protein
VTRRKVRTASAACIALLIGVVAGAQAQEYQQPPTAKPAGCPQTGLLIAGAAGANTLDGTPLSDVIRGGAGNDNVSGRAGRDRISAGAGNDRVSARDNVRDTVDCGSGRRDKVTADRIDSVKSNCELVSRN